MAHTVMEHVRDVLVMLAQVLYYWLVAIVRAILPASIQGKDISGETVLITGAGSGIGRLMAERFAKLKCRLVLWDVNDKGNEETASICKGYGVSVDTYTINLCDREAIYKLADKVKTDVGKIDILVNNAGIVTGKKFLDCPDKMIDLTMQVNIMAHFWTVKAFLPDMMTRNHGHIVNIASSAGLIGVTGLADYCASKFAAVGFDESLRFELMAQGKTGINTTVVCPFFINTGMFEGAKTRFPFLLPILEPAYVADKIVEAVLCNQTLLALPRILYVFFAIKGIHTVFVPEISDYTQLWCIWMVKPVIRFLPHSVAQVLNDHLGVSHCMDNFKGRQLKAD